MTGPSPFPPGVAIDDWDDAYAVRDHVPEAEAVFAGWERDAPRFSEEMRAAGRAEIGLRYGPAARNRWDLFLPEGAPRGLVVFIHGGYWMGFGPEVWSHLAAGPVTRGWAVAMPAYTLAPEAAIAEMTAEVAAFLGAAAARVPDGPIALSGHSAGGHLAARMLCADAPVPDAAAWRIARCVSISGLHDLRPLLRTRMNATLGLDEASAAAESPALLPPVAGARLTAWVGGDERPEFLRQSALIANVWTGLGAACRLEIAPGLHHFDVIDGLSVPDGALCAALLSG